MTTLQGTEARQYPLEQSESAIPKNSPFIYGLGTLSLSAIGQAFGGYYMFYYVDVLGLAVALAAIVNVVYAIWDAVNDPLVAVLAHEESDVRRIAAQELGRLGGQWAVEPLIAALNEEDRQVREVVAEALESITGQEFDDDIGRWPSWWSKQPS